MGGGSPGTTLCHGTGWDRETLLVHGGSGRAGGPCRVCVPPTEFPMTVHFVGLETWWLMKAGGQCTKQCPPRAEGTVSAQHTFITLCFITWMQSFSSDHLVHLHYIHSSVSKELKAWGISLNQVFQGVCIWDVWSTDSNGLEETKYLYYTSFSLGF